MKNLYFEPVFILKAYFRAVPIHSRWIAKVDLKLKYKRRLFALVKSVIACDTINTDF